MLVLQKKQTHSICSYLQYNRHLVIGDALAIALLRARGFSATDFARSHPGGTLGKRLLLTVKQLMRQQQDIPKVAPNSSLKDALVEMTAKRLGMTTIVNQEDTLLGVYTDGDLRRTLEQGKNMMHTTITALMTTTCHTTASEKLAFEVFNEMEQHKITAMPVVNGQQQVIGVIHLHDILQAGVI